MKKRLDILIIPSRVCIVLVFDKMNKIRNMLSYRKHINNVRYISFTCFLTNIR